MGGFGRTYSSELKMQRIEIEFLTNLTQASPMNVSWWPAKCYKVLLATLYCIPYHCGVSQPE